MCDGRSTNVVAHQQTLAVTDSRWGSKGQKPCSIPCPDRTQVHDTITRYREILAVNHSTSPYVIVLTKNLDPATVQAQLTLNCTDTDGAPPAGVVEVWVRGRVGARVRVRTWGVALTPQCQALLAVQDTAAFPGFESSAC